MSVLPIGIGSSGSYQIPNSLRVRASASAYLSRTPASAGNRKTWTWSGWVKRGALGTQQNLFATPYTTSPSTTGFVLRLLLDNTLMVYSTNSSAVSMNLVTTQVFRDPSAHFHLVLSVDTDQATASNRVRVYVNGVQITAFSTATYPALSDATCEVNFTKAHYLGANTLNATAQEFFDGYLSHVHFIDGQALDPTYFGQFNSDGVWTPKAYTGTYGTNGFKLDFSNGSSLTTLGNDASGNGNNWTLNNFSLTAGATYDWMVDTPTNNYCVLSPIDGTPTNASLGVKEGNIGFYTAYFPGRLTATQGVSAGKWYWEIVPTGFDSSNGSLFGIAKDTNTASNFPDYSYYSNGQKYTLGVGGSAYGATYTTGDVIGVALDMDGGTVTFYKNNVSQGVAFSGLTGVWRPSISDDTPSNAAGVAGSINFGQRPFTYTPPTGFKALCTANMPAAPIANGRKHFDVVTRTGNATTSGNTQTVSSLQFQPDLVWVKNRSGNSPTGYSHVLFDGLRGFAGNKELVSNNTNAEGGTNSSQYGYVSAVASNGYTLTAGSDASIPGAYTHQNGQTIVDWLWKAGGAAVTNNAGSITSQVSANTTAGFSIVTYTGTGANATVGHGLGVAPKMVIVKARGNVNGSWAVYHASTGAGGGGLFINSNSAYTADTAMWNNTAPTSTVFSIGTNGNVNQATTFLALCFAEVAGFSKIGSYTGNGSADGPFVFCGFRPRYVMVKRTDVSDSWVILDAARSQSNVMNAALLAQSSGAELVVADADFTSNGFKVRTTSGAWNANGGTYIFMALAENPFGASNTAPATAR